MAFDASRILASARVRILGDASRLADDVRKQAASGLRNAGTEGGKTYSDSMAVTVEKEAVKTGERAGKKLGTSVGKTLNRKLDDLDLDKIRIDADPKSALAAIEKTRDELEEMSRDAATVQIRIDTKRALADLDRFERQLGESGDDGADSFADRFASTFTDRLKELPELVKPAAMAAGAAAGPLLSLALSGAVIGAVGLGGIIGGLALAARDPSVQAHAAGVGKVLGDGMSTAAKIFVPVLDAALEQVAAAGQRSIPKLAGMFTELAPHVNGLVGSLLAAGEAILDGIVVAGSRAGPVLAAMGGFAEKVGKALGEMLEVVSRDSLQAAQSIEFLGDVAEVLINALTLLISGLSGVGLSTLAAGAGAVLLGRALAGSTVASRLGAAAAHAAAAAYGRLTVNALTLATTVARSIIPIVGFTAGIQRAAQILLQSSPIVARATAGLAAYRAAMMGVATTGGVAVAAMTGVATAFAGAGAVAARAATAMTGAATRGIAALSTLLGGPLGAALLAIAAVVTVVANENGKAATAARAHRDGARQLSDALRENNGVITENIRLLAAEQLMNEEIGHMTSLFHDSSFAVEELGTATRKLGFDQKTLTDAWITGGPPLDEMIAKAHRAANAEGEFAGANKQVQHTGAAVEASLIAQKDALAFAARAYEYTRNSAARFTITEATLKTATDAVSTAQKDQKLQLDLLGGAASRAAIRSDALRTATENLFGATEKARDANIGYEASIDRISESAKENGRSLNIKTAAGRANTESVRDALLASREMYLADIRNGVKIEEATRLHTNRTKEITKEAKATGLDNTETKKIITTYGKVPEQEVTDLILQHADRVADAMLDLAAVQQHLTKGTYLEPGLMKRLKRIQTGLPDTKRAMGGVIPGSSPSKTADDKLIAATAGEWVHPVDSVRYYGPRAMAAIQKRQLPREALEADGYASGGRVTFPYKTNVSKMKVPRLEEVVRAAGGLGLGGQSGPTPTIAYNTAQRANASAKVVLAMVEAGLVESGMKNLASRAVPESLKYPHEGVAAGNYDSVGFLQQRASWGSVRSRMNVAESAARFISRAKAKEHRYDTAGALAQGVQVSGLPWRYGEEEARARALIDSVKSGSAGGGGGFGGGTWQQMVAALRGAGFDFDVYSAFRNSKTLSGKQSRHALGKAIDITPTKKIAQFLYSKHAGSAFELINPWTNLHLYKGKPHSYSEAINRQHGVGGAGNDHIHWSVYAKGGRVGNPLADRKYDPDLDPGQFLAMARGGRVPYRSYDSGGYWPSGTVGVNTSGRTEHVQAAADRDEQTRLLARAVDVLERLAPDIGSEVGGQLLGTVPATRVAARRRGGRR